MPSTPAGRPQHVAEYWESVNEPPVFSKHICRYFCTLWKRTGYVGVHGPLAPLNLSVEKGDGGICSLHDLSRTVLEKDTGMIDVV